MAVALYGLSSVYSVFLYRRGFRQDDRINYLVLLLAFGFHCVAMFERGFSLSRCPVNNLFEAITFVLWTIVAAYLVAGCSRRFRSLGAFASPVLFCVGVFALFPELDRHSPQPDFTRGWSSLHASLILLAYGAFGLSSMAATMYLTQERDLKLHKVRAVLALLPSIHRLEKVMTGFMLTGFLLLTVGLALGARTFHERRDEFSFWDTKILWSIFVWGLYLTLLILHHRFSQRGRRFAWGAVGSFVFVLLTFVGTNLLSRIHHPG